MAAVYTDGELDNTSSFGAGDLAWAFSWDRTLGVGQTFQLSKVIAVTIPTPGSLALLGIAGLATVSRRRSA
ncbi:MAG: PEP-CTERM sorting domain-containing protein [Deltaproteobacteria bacterium]|nr:PEP-CTERM sorting domain-containing protein [Deltaproteobacteria bacterium]